MGVILCLETTTKNCSVALAVDGKCEVLREINEAGYSHAERLHPFIMEVLEASDYSKNDLDAIAVSKGPGSYTGLRIGVSAAKGLAYGLGLPLIATDTLKAMAMAHVTDDVDYLVPMLDARRMEVYTAVYDRELNNLEAVNAKILDENSFTELSDQAKVAFIGDGAAKCAELLAAEGRTFYPETFPSAKEMCALAELKWTGKDFEDLAYFEPYYLKEFVGSKPKKLL